MEYQYMYSITSPLIINHLRLKPGLYKGQNKLTVKFKMAVGDVIRIGGRLWSTSICAP